MVCIRSVSRLATAVSPAAAPVPITSVFQLGNKAKVMLWPSTILAGKTEHTTTASAFSFVVPSTPTDKFVDRP